MNHCPVNFGINVTDRQKATHMSPPCCAKESIVLCQRVTNFFGVGFLEMGRSSELMEMTLDRHFICAIART